MKVGGHAGMGPSTCVLVSTFDSTCSLLKYFLIQAVLILIMKHQM